MNAHDPNNPHASIMLADPADAATALLFLAGELDADERQDFAARLAAEPALRAQVDALGSVDAMLRADATRPSDVAASISDRALASSLRIVREQTLLRQQALAHSRHGHHVPRWAWASAAAAMLAVVCVLWVVSSEPTVMFTKSETTDTADVGSTDGEPTSEPWVVFGRIPAVTSDAEAEQEREEADAQIDALEFLATMGEGNDPS